MKLLKASAISIIAISIAGTAMAGDSNGYIGAGGIMYDSEGVYGVEVRAGYNVFENIAVEAQGSFGVTKVDETLGATPLDLGVSTSIAGFIVGRLPVSEKFNVFGRVGYHSTELSVDAPGLTPALNFDLDGLAAGGGVEYFFDGQNGIRGEYTYLKADDYGIDDHFNTFSVGYIFKF